MMMYVLVKRKSIVYQVPHRLEVLDATANNVLACKQSGNLNLMTPGPYTKDRRNVVWNESINNQIRTIQQEKKSDHSSSKVSHLTKLYIGITNFLVRVSITPSTCRQLFDFQVIVSSWQNLLDKKFEMLSYLYPMEENLRLDLRLRFAVSVDEQGGDTPEHGVCMIMLDDSLHVFGLYCTACLTVFRMAG